MTGGEAGPGKSVVVPLTSVSRQTYGAKIRGTYYLISIDRS